MTQVGYIRVSSVGQSLDVQRDKMIAAGVEPADIFEEKKSGLNANRQALKECLRFVRRGDTLIITRIDRLARSTVDLLNIVRELESKGVAFRVLDQSIDTSNPAGRAMLQMLAVFAEFETAIRSERQMDGVAMAKAKGVKFGRKRELTAETVNAIVGMRSEGHTVPQVMKTTGLSKASVYRALAMAEPEQ